MKKNDLDPALAQKYEEAAAKAVGLPVPSSASEDSPAHPAVTSRRIVPGAERQFEVLARGGGEKKLMQFCSRHMADMGQRLRFLGLWKYVRAEDVRETALAYLAGTIKPEQLDPLVILMIEIGSKACRMADGGAGKARIRGCPLCAIPVLADDAAADVKVIRGMSDVVRTLLVENGRRP